MSKAFTHEDAGVPEPPVKRGRVVPPGARYFTPEGYEDLKRRAETRRKELDAAHAPAREREELNVLEALLAAAVVVKAPDADSERLRIAFGAWVELEDEDGQAVMYRIVGADEADPKAARLSVESPLAKALLGKTRNDELELQLPKGKRTYRIVQFRF
jgi:transcription elongation factor GreB